MQHLFEKLFRRVPENSCFYIPKGSANKLKACLQTASLEPTKKLRESYNCTL